MKSKFKVGDVVKIKGHQGTFMVLPRRHKPASMEPLDRRDVLLGAWCGYPSGWMLQRLPAACLDLVLDGTQALPGVSQ